MTPHLEQLKRLVHGGDFDAESREEVERLESRLMEALDNQRLLTVTAVRDYIAHLVAEIARCKEALSERVDLPERERIRLHERKEACRDFLRFFQPVNSVEHEIKHYLDLNAPKAEEVAGKAG